MYYPGYYYYSLINLYLPPTPSPRANQNGEGVRALKIRTRGTREYQPHILTAQVSLELLFDFLNFKQIVLICREGGTGYELKKE